MGKTLLESKTIGITVGIGAVAVILKHYFGIETPLEVQTAIFVVLALIMRIVTKEPIKWE
jgi:hypothetical protein